MKKRRWRTMAVLLLVALALSNPNWITLITYAYSANSVREVASFLRGFGFWTPAISIVLMILQAVLAPLPSTLVAGANGALFGVYWGTLLSWVGGMVGATVSFWLARLLGQDVFSRWIAPRHR
jgi:uncharacterized membrane protein YdjX (TVP38/TMEM64 family)